jgi:hypothetical protein
MTALLVSCPTRGADGARGTRRRSTRYSVDRLNVSAIAANSYFDNYFREVGACIHSFAVINPASLQAGAAGKQIAIEQAFIFPLYGVEDPRVPGNAVPASIKWLNDELDDVQSLAERYPNDALKANLEGVHGIVIAGLRTLPSGRASRTIAPATSDAGMKERNADNWDKEEIRALGHVVNTLDIFSLPAPVTHEADDIGHAVGKVGGAEVDIVAVVGETHEKCMGYAEKKIVPGVQRSVIVVMKDEDGQPWDPREGKFLRPERGRLGGPKKFTDPQSRVLHLGYSNLLNMYRQSQTVAELEAKLNAATA